MSTTSARCSVIGFTPTKIRVFCPSPRFRSITRLQTGSTHRRSMSRRDQVLQVRNRCRHTLLRLDVAVIERNAGRSDAQRLQASNRPFARRTAVLNEPRRRLPAIPIRVI